MFSSSSLAKLSFVLSVAVLGVGYGIAAQQWGWPPSSLAKQAFLQAESLGFVKSNLYSHPAVFDREGARTLRPDQRQPGLTTVTSWWKEAGNLKFGVKLLDEKGKAVHEWWLDRGAAFPENPPGRRRPLGTDLSGSLLLPDGDLVVNLGYVGMARLNACGEVLWTLSEGNHHLIAKGQDGSFWVSAVSPERKRASERYPDGYPGLGGVWVDRILHVSGDGEILKDLNVIDILHDNDLEHLLFQHRLTSGDVTHSNDVEPLPPSMADAYPSFEAGDLLVSLRNINVVLVVDPETRTVKWHTSENFIQQHDPDFLGNGWIGVFDNNWRRRTGGSRILGFQPETGSTEVLFQPQHLDRFYTVHRGSWEKLENGNLLLTESAAGRVVEVSGEGRLVWEWVHESYESKVPAVPTSSRHDVTRKEVSSWPCSSVGTDRASGQK